jgi:hypothetical protein
LTRCFIPPYASGATANKTLNSILNFKFTEYIPGVADHFKTILNTPASYKKMTDQMDATSGWGSNNSFNTDTWRGSLTYYGVAAGSNATISAIITAYMAQYPDF